MKGFLKEENIHTYCTHHQDSPYSWWRKPDPSRCLNKEEVCGPYLFLLTVEGPPVTCSDEHVYWCWLIWTIESHFWCLNPTFDTFKIYWRSWRIFDNWFSLLSLSSRRNLSVGIGACSHIGVLLLWHITASNTQCDIMLSDLLSYRSIAISYSCENDGKNERCALPSKIFMLLVHSVKAILSVTERTAESSLYSALFHLLYTQKDCLYINECPV